MSHSQYKNFISCMMQLSDDNFTSLTRNYLGPSYRSFNRAQTSEELARFLLQEEVILAIKKNLEQVDLEYLSLISCYEIADFRLFKAFFMTSSDVHIGWKLNNLEERMLVFYDSKELTYRLNPLFVTAFKPFNLGFDYLFSYQSEAIATTLWFNSNHLSAYLSIYQHQRDHPKKIEMNHDISKTEIQVLHRALSKLSIIDEGGLNKSRLENFSQLSFILQVTYLVAAYCSDDIEQQQVITKVIQHLFTNYHHKAISIEIVGRLYYLYAHHRMPPEIMNYLEVCKIWQCDNDVIILKEIASTLKHPIYIEADLSCHIMPQQQLLASIALAFILDQYDVVSRYSINQQSFFRALSVGYNLESFIDALNTDGIVNLSGSLKTTLSHWQELYESSQIFHGYIIKFSPNKNRLIKNSQWLTPYLDREISDGYYLLKEAPSKEFALILKKIGCPSSHHIIEPSPPVSSIKIEQEIVQKKIDSVLITPSTPHSPQLYHPNREIQRRINRKIIFFDYQLNHQPRPLPSAQGFDFQGKLRLIKSAITEGLDLEIEVIKNDHLAITHVKPILLKKNSDSYVLEAINHANNQIIRGSIESIVSVTLVKPTLLH